MILCKVITVEKKDTENKTTKNVVENKKMNDLLDWAKKPVNKKIISAVDDIISLAKNQIDVEKTINFKDILSDISKYKNDMNEQKKIDILKKIDPELNEIMTSNPVLETALLIVFNGLIHMLERENDPDNNKSKYILNEVKELYYISLRMDKFAALQKYDRIIKDIASMNNMDSVKAFLYLYFKLFFSAMKLY